MANYPTQKEIRYWSTYAIYIFNSMMPSIGKAFPSIHIATESNFVEMRTKLVEQTGCTHTEANMDEAAIMEYIVNNGAREPLVRSFRATSTEK